MKTKKRLLISIVTLLVIALAGCGSSKNNQPSASPTATTVSADAKNNINIQQYEFQPADITINKGETITWTNQDAVGHDVVVDSFKSTVLKKAKHFLKPSTRPVLLTIPAVFIPA